MKKSDGARTLATRSLATWFGCGLFPWAPGTIGSLGALLPALALSRWVRIDGAEIAMAGALLFGPAVWAADATARQTGLKDPGLIVVDEVVGQWITFAGAMRLNWTTWVAAFVLFRAFDIAKPYPIRKIEHLPGGLGIVADDALAGVYAALVLFSIGWLTQH